MIPSTRPVRTQVAACWFLLVASMISLRAMPGAAQASESLTLQAAVDRALAANPTIAAARSRGAVNLAGLALAGERPNPEVSAEFEKETPKRAFGVALPIELGGKRAKRIAVGEAAVRAGEAELTATVVQVRTDVRRAYFGVLVAETRLSLLQELRDLAGRVSETAQTRFDSGDAPRLEVLQAGLARASADNEASAAEGALVAARTRLNALLGQPLGTVQALTTTLDPGDPVPVDVALGLARAGNAELAVLDRRIEEQRARVSLAQALRTPDVVPTATITQGSEPEFDVGWRAGVAVAVPVFTSHEAGVRVERSSLDQLTAERQAAGARVTAEVTAAASTVGVQRQTYLRYRDSILPQAQQVEQLAQDSYELGQTGIAALLQALQASRDVRLRSLDAMSELQAALAELEQAIGAPLP